MKPIPSLYSARAVPRRLSALAALLQTPAGRRLLQLRLWARGYPLLARLGRAYRRSLVRRTRLVAVVGSFGKTTTTAALRAALALPPHQHGRGNSGSSLPLNLLSVRPGDRHAVLEVGIDGPGQMAPYRRLLQPDVVVVTSIGSEHRSSLGSLQTTRQEKAEMLRALPPSGLAVLNGDDPNVRWMAGQTRARLITCGLGPDNEVRATDLQLDWPHGQRFTLRAAGQAYPLRIRLLGQHQLFSILAAAAVALAERLPPERFLPALAALPPTSGRLSPLALPNGAWLLRDDIKSSLETIDAALDLLAEIPASRKTVVIGDVSEPPGSQGPIYRRLGERLAGIADRVIVVGDQHQRYASGAVRAGLSRQAIVKAGHDPLLAASLAGQALRPGDLVFVKGRDVQRLERVALALAGRPVRCALPICRLPQQLSCADCAMLERGWAGQPGPEIIASPTSFRRATRQRPEPA
jgi:UDP-N-acetylmuramoyl-tripeptide--D-alanyl-D-alanine ligase